MIRSILFVLALLVASPAGAQDARTDVPAGTTTSNFTCKVAQAPICPTCLSGDSIQLFRSNSTREFTAVCADTVGESPVLIGFMIPYIAGDLHPEFKARAFAEPGCTGVQSFDTANSCIVTYQMIAPMFVSPFVSFQ